MQGFNLPIVTPVAAVTFIFNYWSADQTANHTE